MNTTVGYALVSQVHTTHTQSCGKPGCVTWDICSSPERPRCHAACVRDPLLLAEHPECQVWERKYTAWCEAHFILRPNGRTSLGPLHYFRDCIMLTKRSGARRKDARIVGLDPAATKALGLPVCKHCQAAMATYEQQLLETVIADWQPVEDK